MRHPRRHYPRVARLYARSERSIIFWGMGISQHTHSTDSARCLIALALVTSQVGRRPACIRCADRTTLGRLRCGADPDGIPRLQVGGGPTIRGMYEKFWGTTLPPKRASRWSRSCTPSTTA